MKYTNKAQSGILWETGDMIKNIMNMYEELL